MATIQRNPAGLILRNGAGKWVTDCGGPKCWRRYTLQYLRTGGRGFSIPVPQEKRCFASPPSPSWRKISQSVAECVWEIWVPIPLFTAPAGCAVDGDCAAVDPGGTGGDVLDLHPAPDPGNCACDCFCCDTGRVLPLSIDNTNLVATPDPRGDWWHDPDVAGPPRPPHPQTMIRGSVTLPPFTWATYDFAGGGVWPEGFDDAVFLADRFVGVDCIDDATNTWRVHVIGAANDQLTFGGGSFHGSLYQYEGIATTQFACVNGRPSGSIIVPMTWGGGWPPPDYFADGAHPGEPTLGSGDCGQVIVTFAP